MMARRFVRGDSRVEHPHESSRESEIVESLQPRAPRKGYYREGSTGERDAAVSELPAAESKREREQRESGVPS